MDANSKKLSKLDQGLKKLKSTLENVLEVKDEWAVSAQDIDAVFEATTAFMLDFAERRFGLKSGYKVVYDVRIVPNNSK